jgi:hypothetical protein
VRRNGIGTGRTPKTAPERDKREAKRHPIALKRVLRHALYRMGTRGTSEK